MSAQNSSCSTVGNSYMDNSRTRMDSSHTGNPDNQIRLRLLRRQPKSERLNAGRAQEVIPSPPLQLRETFSSYFPLSCCLALVDCAFAGLNSYAHLGALTLYNGIGFDRSRGPQERKIANAHRLNGLRFIERADERLMALFGSRICNQRFQRVRLRVTVV